MGICYLCNEEPQSSWRCYYCDKCNKIKRMISLYSLNRVYEILDTVLVRTRQQQSYKIKKELDKEEDNLDKEKKDNSVFKPFTQ